MSLALSDRHRAEGTSGSDGATALRGPWRGGRSEVVADAPGEEGWDHMAPGEWRERVRQ